MVDACVYSLVENEEREIVDYTVIEKYSVSDLVAAVQTKIREGWTPVGKLTVQSHSDEYNGRVTAYIKEMVFIQ